MTHINIPPTRSNLLQMKKELQFAREGYEILDRKRVVLTSELIRVAHDAEALQEQVWKMLASAYRALEQAKLTMGQEHVTWAALAMSKTVDVQLKFRGVMGVPIPHIESWAIHLQPWTKRAPLSARCSNASPSSPNW
jgi:V/A-type H+-transporting ATPase subunit D